MRRVFEAAAAAIAVALLLTAAPGRADDAGIDVTVTVPSRTAGAFTVSNAQLRWGLNQEAGSAAFFGGCHFLSAGAVGNTGGSRLWTESDGFFRAREGSVTIERPVAAAGSVGQRQASFAERCSDPSGRQVTGGASSGITAVIADGTGSVDPATGSARIDWTGSFTVVSYGGLAYWWVTDPVLTLSGGTGTLRATVAGFGTSREDTTVWQELAPRTVDLATLRGVDLTGSLGFATDPAYRGVQVELPAGATPQVRTGPDWGAFPQSLVDFHQLTGLASYWYSSGGSTDARKPASTLYISYSADAPLTPSPPSDPSDPAGAQMGASAASPRTPASAGSSGAVAAASAAPVPVDAKTVFPLSAGLVPAAVAAASGSPLAWAAAALLLAAAAVLGAFRRGWLVWPSTGYREATTPLS